MKTIFYSSRMFQTSDGWWVYMRSGDEQNDSIINMSKVEYYMEDGIPIAGPFKRKALAERWLANYLTDHHDNRIKMNYISDKVILTESCYI